MAIALVALAALAFSTAGSAADQSSGSDSPACNRLQQKLERQRSGLRRAGNQTRRAAIRRNIGVTRRLRRLACHPQPRPRLPRDFRGSGRYLVPDLGVNVPFTWTGSDGNSQMIAGGENYPIYFMNLIYGGSLYTITYRWPGVTIHPCSRIPGFSLDQLNQIFATAAYVGPEILNRHRLRYVNHFRLATAFPPGAPSGLFPRIPFAEADIYVDERNPGTIWRILHFGFQNIYDPNLDEWINMHTFKHTPGGVTLPPTCQPPAS
ncbi:MAG TPA: hypothetical protein VGE91_03240 [Solirubrobacterales bacterium]